jgi:hypothetical protein
MMNGLLSAVRQIVMFQHPARGDYLRVDGTSVEANLELPLGCLNTVLEERN